MDRTTELVDYTQVIKQINGALKKLTFAKKYDKKEIFVEVSKELNDLSLTILSDKQAASEGIKQHYNSNVYDSDNGIQNPPNYLNTSIIREIVQNMIDCNYNEPQIDIVIDFDDSTKTITFNYNEEGFKISNIISFLSLGHTTKGSNNTGAFGVGAKGTISNAECVKITSFYAGENSHSVFLSISPEKKEYREDKNLVIHEFLLGDNNSNENYTKLELTLNSTVYQAIKDNLLDLSGEKAKGKYITPIDLTFAALKQPNKQISINIANKVTYSVHYVENESYATFNLNDQLLVGFKVFKGEASEFSYLIPYNRGQSSDMPSFISRDSYNYFSTYELTGKIEGALTLPKFFINVPTIDKKYETDEDKKYYITIDRKGIQENKKEAVEKVIASDFRAIIHKFEDDLVIELDKWNHRYILKYLYEFIEYQEKQSPIAKDWSVIKNEFHSKIAFQRGDQQVKLADVKNFEYEKDMLLEAQKLKNNVFIFKEEVSEFYGAKGRKTFDLHINFRIVFYGEELPIIEMASFYQASKAYYEIAHYSDYKHSNCYKNTYINNRILYNLNYRLDDEIYLISAENDDTFTEDTLLNLLKALYKNSKIVAEFDSEKNILEVGEHLYEFEEHFAIRQMESVYYAWLLTGKINDKFFDLICTLYKKTLFSAQTSPLEKLSYYKNNKFKLSFNHNVTNIIKVSKECTYANRTVEIVLDNIDISNIDYEQIVHVTGLTNYKLLIGKAVNDFSLDQNIVDSYNLDLDILKKYANVSDVEQVLEKIFISETNLQLGDEDLIAFVNDGVFKDIVQLRNIASPISREQFDYILIISKKNKSGKHSKIRVAKIGEILDALLESKGKIKQFFKPIDKPLIKMLDQFHYKLKPVTEVNRAEIEILKLLLNKTKDEYKKIVIAKDLTSKLYGYSTCCSLCNYNTDVLNAFHVKEIHYLDQDIKRTLNLYICGNHYFESEGWIILDVNFQNANGEYDISFSEWLVIIQEKEMMAAHLLKCELQIIKKSSYRIFELADEKEEQSVKKQRYRFVLTPLLAVKWLVDNTH